MKDSIAELSFENKAHEVSEKRMIELRRDNSEIISGIYSNYIGMKFILIPSGNFMMGSEDDDREKPIHDVAIIKPFYMGIYPVTQYEWKQVMGENPLFSGVSNYLLKMYHGAK